MKWLQVIHASGCCGICYNQLCRGVARGAAMEQVARTPANFVLMAVAMLGLIGLEAARRIKAHADVPRVVIVTMSDDSDIAL